jgi:hypothetical protein
MARGAAGGAAVADKAAELARAHGHRRLELEARLAAARLAEPARKPALLAAVAREARAAGLGSVAKLASR